MLCGHGTSQVDILHPSGAPSFPSVNKDLPWAPVIALIPPQSAWVHTYTPRRPQLPVFSEPPLDAGWFCQKLGVQKGNRPLPLHPGIILLSLGALCPWAYLPLVSPARVFLLGNKLGRVAGG